MIFLFFSLFLQQIIKFWILNYKIQGARDRYLSLSLFLIFFLVFNWMAESMNSKSQQQFFNAAMLATYEFNPKSMLESEQFPDILNHLSTEQIRMLFELLAQPVYSHLVNKKGPLGGYTALHWMAIKNELELIEFLVTRCRADVNCQANLGETPLLICIKYVNRRNSNSIFR